MILTNIAVIFFEEFFFSDDQSYHYVKIVWIYVMYYLKGTDKDKLYNFYSMRKFNIQEDRGN